LPRRQHHARTPRHPRPLHGPRARGGRRSAIAGTIEQPRRHGTPDRIADPAPSPLMERVGVSGYRGSATFRYPNRRAGMTPALPAALERPRATLVRGLHLAELALDGTRFLAFARTVAGVVRATLAARARGVGGLLRPV